MVVFEQTLMYQEVMRVFDKQVPNVFQIECSLIINNQIYTPWRLMNIDLTRDYNRNNADDMQISISMSPGIWQRDILPYTDDLLVNITTTPLYKDGQQNTNAIPTTRQYRGIYIDETQRHMRGSHADNISFSSMNLTNMKTYYIQLLEPVFEKIRARSLGVTLKETNMWDAVRLLLGKESKNASNDAKFGITAVDVVKPINDKIYDHIIIPDGTPLLAIPQFLQIKCGGMYNSGCGFYLQQGKWYVYPEFDITRFNIEPRSLTIYNVPENKFPHVETTYRLTANQIIIIATGEMQVQDDSNQQQLNYGNGTRFADSNNITEDFGKFKNGKYNVARIDNASEFITIERPTGINNAMVSKQRITSNPFNEYAALARRQVMHVQVQWHNSNVDLLYPGMPVKFIYMHQDGQKEIIGNLSVVQSLKTGDGASTVNGNYTENAALTLLVNII